MIDTYHESFKKRWHKSHKAVEKVAAWLVYKGIETTILPQHLTPDAASRMDYVDNGDIEIVLEGRKKIVEVKGRDLKYKNGIFPFEIVNICNAPSFDRANPKPSYYFMLDSSLEIAAILDVDKYRQNMFTGKISDNKRTEKFIGYKVDRRYLSYRLLTIPR